jgi:hypothetical protein
LIRAASASERVPGAAMALEARIPGNLFMDKARRKDQCTSCIAEHRVACFVDA